MASILHHGRARGDRAQLVMPADVQKLRRGVQTTPPGTSQAQEDQAWVAEAAFAPPGIPKAPGSLASSTAPAQADVSGLPAFWTPTDLCAFPPHRA